jgi:hypothetical protein
MDVGGRSSPQLLNKKFERDALLLIALYQIAQRNGLKVIGRTDIRAQKSGRVKSYSLFGSSNTNLSIDLKQENLSRHPTLS